MVSVTKQKADIRQRYLRKREKCTLAEVSLASDRINRYLTSFYSAKGSWILCYIAIGKEVNITSTINSLLNNGCHVCVPAYNVRTMDYMLAQFLDWEELEIIKNVPQPKKLVQVKPSKIATAFVPGVAFARNGTRVGFGKGIYDRLLGQLRPQCQKIGVCYGWQVIEKLPKEAHDQQVDFIVTEDGIITARNKTS